MEIAAFFLFLTFIAWMIFTESENETFEAKCPCGATISTSSYSAFSLWQHYHQNCS